MPRIAMTYSRVAPHIPSSFDNGAKSQKRDFVRPPRLVIFSQKFYELAKEPDLELGPEEDQ
jgi:hypothetical protein